MVPWLIRLSADIFSPVLTLLISCDAARAMALCAAHVPVGTAQPALASQLFLSLSFFLYIVSHVIQTNQPQELWAPPLPSPLPCLTPLCNALPRNQAWQNEWQGCTELSTELQEPWKQAKFSLKMCMMLGNVGILHLNQMKIATSRGLTWDDAIDWSPKQEPG
jgi:hypothetical protein